MRLIIVTLGVAVFLAAGLASAGGVSPGFPPDRMPAGAHWDAERGLLVLDEPIPVHMPESNLLGEYGTMLYYDNGMMYYLAYQQEEYFATTKFPVPVTETGFFELRAVMVACFNDPGVEPEEGKVVVYFHESSPECYQMNPEGDMLGEVWVYSYFTGIPYSNLPDPYNPPMVSWTLIELNPSIVIDLTEHDEFWIAWDYRPGAYELGGYYTIGGFNGNMGPGDDMRFFERFGTECPSLLPPFGPWLIRGLGESLDEAPSLIDIKPTSCPNPIKRGDFGDVTVAMVGSRSYPREYLEQVLDTTFHMVVDDGRLYPYKISGTIEELVAAMYRRSGSDPCTCLTERYDGFVDHGYHFENEEVWLALEEIVGRPLIDKEFIPVTFKWERDIDGDGVGDVVESGQDCFRATIFETRGQGGGGGGGELSVVTSGPGEAFALHQNSPNPFRAKTSISFTLAEAGRARLTVHDASGRLVGTLVDAELGPGTYSTSWETGVPSGVYFCRLIAGMKNAGMRMVVTR